mmetsp:Transcript_13858/g.33281  ORF Transcript_13858/g.33281 Transcript_13858/m.33281 type:complete len:91 (+) Transcript_13858:128-400(+)
MNNDEQLAERIQEFKIGTRERNERSRDEQSYKLQPPQYHGQNKVTVSSNCHHGDDNGVGIAAAVVAAIPMDENRNACIYEPAIGQYQTQR